MKNETESLGEQLVQAVVHFPEYAVKWTVGLLVVVLTESVVTTVAVLAVLSAFAIGSVLWGFVVFFAAYTGLRYVAHLSDTIGFGSTRLANTYAAINAQNPE